MFTSYMLNIVLKEAVSITLPLGSCLCLRQHFVGKKKKKIKLQIYRHPWVAILILSFGLAGIFNLCESQFPYL